MKTIIRSAILAGSVAALSACNIIQPEVLDLNGINPTLAKNAPDVGTPFQRSLHAGYADFGRYEYQQSDFRDARYFNTKARQAAAGQSPLPTELSERPSIRQEFLNELVPARARLMSALATPGFTETFAIPLSSAQVYFDCWAEQAEEGHQYDDIAYCKNGFETAMGQLVARPVAAAPAPAAQTARPFLIFFDWDKAVITDSARPTLNQISASIKNGNPATIRIAGHADKSGTDKYNDALSRRRADAVLNALQQQGLQRNKATVESFGESRPLVDTADGVREPQNRRVEVTIQ